MTPHDAGSLTTTLGALVESGTGFIQTGPFGSQLHARDYVKDGIPVVMPQQLGDNEIRSSDIAFVGEHDRDRLLRHVMCEGDIVFSRRGDVTRRAYITRRESGWLCGTGCLLLRLNHPACDNRYLVRFLGLQGTREYLTQNAIGATMPNLNQGILSSVPVVLPPRDRQERIVDAISAYDDLIENNRKRIRLLERATRILYEEWFVRLRFPGHEGTTVTNGVPDGWETKSLSALFGDVRKSVDPKTLPPDTAYIGLEHMPRRSITLSEWTSSEGVESAKLAFREGDVLFGKIRPYFHKVGFTLTAGIASSDAIVIRPVDRYYEYMLLLLSSDGFVSLASKTVREGSKMPRADWNFLSASDVLIPEPATLNAFRRVTRPVLDQLRNRALSNRRLAAARDMLLPRLMSGKFAA